MNRLISKQSNRGIFGLVGLAQEQGKSDKLVQSRPSLIIHHGYKRELKIHRLTLNFGSALLQIGAAIRSCTTIEPILKKLGEEILSEFEALERTDR
jgi:hypothetical protein